MHGTINIKYIAQRLTLYSGSKRCEIESYRITADT